MTSGLCRASCSLRVPLGAAPGFRDAGNNKGYGTLYAVGAYGYSWSSTGLGAYAHHLNFRYSWLLPQYSYHRAYGLQLRCLQK